MKEAGFYHTDKD